MPISPASVFDRRRPRSALILMLFGAFGARTEAATSAGDPVIAGAGDIACAEEDDADECKQAATAEVLHRLNATWVFTLGDHAYPDGRLRDFRDLYDPTWGRLKSRTRPSLGNHDYAGDGRGSQAYVERNYFAYFDDPALAGDPSKGYYSYDVPTTGDAWHVIVLNTGACDDERRAAAFCGARSPQRAWLRKDLEQHQRGCILVYWHQPRFSDGTVHGDDTVSRYFWNDLYEHNATVVLNGHDHIYERFAPMNPAGERDEQRGIFEFIVGTGGADPGECAKSRRPTSEVCRGNVFGVLALTLHPSSFTYEFKPAKGTQFHDGPHTLPCRGAR